MTTHYCTDDISPDCPGHEGWQRITSCLTGALDQASTDADASMGDVSELGWYVDMHAFDQAETLEYDGVKVTIPANTYVILIHRDNGSVTRVTYQTRALLDEDWSVWAEDYRAWDDLQEQREQEASDAREAYITSSTGRIGS
jgi:hypothetical protein